MLEEIAWVGSGDEKELVSEFCQDVSLFNPPTAELAAGEEDETPDRAVGWGMDRAPDGAERGCMQQQKLGLHVRPLTREFSLSPPG